MPSNNDCAFYRSFFSLFTVLALQNVVTLGVNLADNIMLGRYSEAALSGVTAVNQIQFVYQQLLLALGDGLVIFCSQYWASGRPGRCGKSPRPPCGRGWPSRWFCFCWSACFPTPPSACSRWTRPSSGKGCSTSPSSRFTYLFFAVTQILLATLRSTEVVRIAFYLSILTLCVNCAINYVLIYGAFGAPELGAAGAAIGTLAARIVETAVLLLYIRKTEKHLHLTPRAYLQADRTLDRDYFKLTLPMLFVQGLWGINTALQTVILGHMDSSAIAANSVASTIFLMVKSMAVGAASAASVVIGKTIGTGDIPLVRRYAKILQRLFLLIGVISGLLLFVIRIPLLGLYDDLTPETRKMANDFLLILSVVAVGMSYQMPTNNGIIRGGGNAMFVVKLDLISIWGIVIPLSCILAFAVKAPPAAVVCCLNADQLFKCVPAFLEARYGRWIRKLTREEAGASG